ncbi:hypothetical protein D0866_01800 [Hortaea werneckii]|uniref:Dephospho-CoA kinase n=1 Tax=Hortaea werneckii TaxID=91943 RepID=A0A3M7BJF1_HORWE|nr:hypothetical protein D0866_01800 [Hortaea werneckii]
MLRFSKVALCCTKLCPAGYVLAIRYSSVDDLFLNAKNGQSWSLRLVKFNLGLNMTSPNDPAAAAAAASKAVLCFIHISNMLLLGLTGSIATGKSTVSQILSSSPYNLPIVDADKVARQVVEPGTAGYNQIVAHFGPSTPDLLVAPSPENGGEAGHNGKGRPLNRPALGRRVFGEGKDEDRKALNKIVHPAVRREMYKQMVSAYLRGCWAVVLDVPLLFESGWEPLCGTIMVVAVRDAKVQMERLRARDEHLSEEDARNRVASQWDVRDKAERCMRRGGKAGVVVWNDGGKEDLRREVDRVMAVVQRGHPQWWAWLLLFCPPLAAASATWSYVRSWWIKRHWEQEKQREKAKL